MKPMPTFRSALIALTLLSLSGCSLISSGSKTPTTLYAPDVRISAQPGWPQVSWQLVIAQPSAARLIDSPRINVRPTPGELQVYRDVAWAQPATDLLQDTLLRAFEDSGRIAGVARPDGGIRADYKLAIDLRRFESDYAGRPLPSATIELNAKLLHNADQRIAAVRTFLIAEPAAASDTEAVAAAFEAALTKATQALVGWTLVNGQRDALAHPVTP